MDESKHMLIIGIVAVLAIICIVFMINSSMKAQVARPLTSDVTIYNPQRSVYGEYQAEPPTGEPRELRTIQQWPAYVPPEPYRP